MPRQRRSRSSDASARQRAAKLRIIGGTLRGRSIRYNGDPATRPMKDRVRQAVFDLLGPAVKNLLVIDLFAGTGAMALEALSRGAARAVLIERSFPVARVIAENAQTLGIADRVTVVTADAFPWFRQLGQLEDRPWLVFCCPPYDFYRARQADMAALIGALVRQAPGGSLLVVEADDRLNTAELPQADRWDVRRYAPAVIAVFDVPRREEKT